jgi:hypothetical protein
MVAQNREYFFAAINDEKMELNSIVNGNGIGKINFYPIKLVFHNWVIAKSYSHVGRNKRV